MRSETIAIHGGYEVDPTTKAVAVPIYQTVAYAFDSADHGAALFNLEAEGYRYTRISNPTTAVLERRVAALEGGVEALCVSSGQAALNYAVAQPRRAWAATSSRCRSSTARRTRCSRISCRARASTSRFAAVRQPGRDRGAHRRQDAGRLLRERRQSGRQHLRYRSAGRSRRTGTASRSSSTTPWPRRSCCGRSSTAPTSSCTR